MVYDQEFTDKKNMPDVRMMFRRMSAMPDGTNVYEFTGRSDAVNQVATETAEGDTLESGANGAIKLMNIPLDAKLTAVETKNLEGYASFETEKPVVMKIVDPEMTIADVLEKVSESEEAAYFVDEPVTSDYTVIKKYSDGNENHKADAIKVTLYRSIGDKEEEVETQTLSASTGWKYTW